ncbi:archaeosortase A [Halostella pelagica]|uniref:archaeosortase A n=1 Tax=Halostella pelagica TaxID=2583824 RepID=UPI0010815B8A|nr:archaeosortase A [Halostella pelagica]
MDTDVIALSIPGVFAPLASVSDALAWTVVAAFVVASALTWAGRRTAARYLASATWVLFGVFWLSVFPTFWFEMKSAIEGSLSLVAVPACVYTGYLLYDGRESLLTLSHAVGVMGLVYLPAETVPLFRRFLVETVAAQTYAVITALGYSPEFIPVDKDVAVQGYLSMFVFEDATGHTYTTHIVTACTGIGSMSIFGGLIAAVRAPLRRKAKALGIAVAIIWVLNIARNVFIAVAFGRQWFQQEIFITIATEYAGYQDPKLASYFIADRVVSQSLSVVALVAITWLVVRELPELLDVIEEALFVVTGTEYDLADALGQPVRADGGPDE